MCRSHAKGVRCKGLYSLRRWHCSGLGAISGGRIMQAMGRGEAAKRAKELARIEVLMAERGQEIEGLKQEHLKVRDLRQGRKQANKVVRAETRLRKLEDRRAELQGPPADAKETKRRASRESRRARHKRRCAARLRKRAENMVADMHWRLAKWLCNQADVVVLPKFNAGEMVLKKNKAAIDKGAQAVEARPQDREEDREEDAWVGALGVPRAHQVEGGGVWHARC